MGETKMGETARRRAIVEVYRELVARGLNSGSSGNVSVRHGKGMLITPTGCTEETLRAGDIVLAGLNGVSDGPLKPSSEWLMHAAVYQRVPEAMAIVHAHADSCVALSCLRKPLPPFHYMIQALGAAEVACVAYHPFGTAALGNAAAAALASSKACLLSNHGMLARGKNLREAFDAALLLETLCRQYLAILSVGKPVLLTRAEMATVARQFEAYGRQPRARARPRWSQH
jgi:L-fuculose-phosphate aldolase